MQKRPKKKTLALLRYRDQIVEWHRGGESIAEITRRVNYRLARTRDKLQVSDRTISNWITRYGQS
jgi:transposase